MHKIVSITISISIKWAGILFYGAVSALVPPKEIAVSEMQLGAPGIGLRVNPLIALKLSLAPKIKKKKRSKAGRKKSKQKVSTNKKK